MNISASRMALFSTFAYFFGFSAAHSFGAWEKIQNLDQTQDSLFFHLSKQGLRSENGKMVFVTPANCMELLGDCSGLNQGSSYGTYVFEDWSWETPIRTPRLQGWAFDPDQAIIQIGLTPPPSKYFSYTPYIVHKRSAPTGSPLSRVRDAFYFSYLFLRGGPALHTPPDKNLVFASLGDSINQLDIQERIHQSPFNAEVAIVTVSNSHTKERVVQALLEAGISEQQIFINVLPKNPLPSLQVEFGHGKKADDFTVLNRIALPENKEELEAYQSNPPLRLIRVSPEYGLNLPDSPLPLPPLKSPRPLNTPNENLYQNLLNQLQSRIEKKFENKAKLRDLFHLDSRAFNLYGDSGFAFLENNKNAMGDNRDCLYSITSFDFKLGCETEKRARFFTLPKGFFAIAIGINEAEIGAVLYSNLVFYEMDYHSPVAAIDSTQPEFIRSASPYLPKEFSSSLFAVAFSQNCSEIEGVCVPIQKKADDSNPFLILAQRSYVDLKTRTRPEPFISSRLLIFSQMNLNKDTINE